MVVFDVGMTTLEPLHTQAMSRDHEIVRAQKKVSKGFPRHLQNHVVWSQTPKCSVKSYVTRPSTKCYLLQQISIHASPHTW